MRMKKNHYEKPQTFRTEVEVENGFMAASVYEKPENSESLEIKDQQVDTEHIFDFSNEQEWN